MYGDKVAADIERNCAVRLVLRPAGLSDAKKISDQLGTYTFKARSRNMGTWGGGGGSTSESDQRRPLLLPQEVEMLPENDLIVFRRGMYATYGKKVSPIDHHRCETSNSAVVGCRRCNPGRELAAPSVQLSRRDLVPPRYFGCARPRRECFRQYL